MGLLALTSSVPWTVWPSFPWQGHRGVAQLAHGPDLDLAYPLPTEAQLARCTDVAFEPSKGPCPVVRSRRCNEHGGPVVGVESVVGVRVTDDFPRA
jgi:hypothetical protein